MDETQKKALGIRIREKREQLEMSQTELAKSVNKSSAAYIAFIEAGERNVSAMDLMLIARSLGTTVSELLGESEKKNIDVMHALRSDKELTAKDRRTMEELYQHFKDKNAQGNWWTRRTTL